MSAVASARSAATGDPVRLNRNRSPPSCSTPDTPGVSWREGWSAAIGHLDCGPAQLAQISDAVDFDKAPGTQDRYPVAYGFDLGKLMRTEKHRLAPLACCLRRSRETLVPSTDPGRLSARRARAGEPVSRMQRRGPPSAGCRSSRSWPACRARDRNGRPTRRGRPRRHRGPRCRAAQGFRRPSVPATAQHPLVRRQCGDEPDGRRPPRNRISRALPAVGRINPSSRRIVVDLPAPLGPRNPNTSPGATVMLRSSTATTRPNRLVRPSTRMAGLTAVRAGDPTP